MITMNSPTIPAEADVPATLQTLSDMLGLLTNPEASKARVAELQAATASLQQTIADEKKQMAALLVSEAEHNAALAQKSADASDKLAAAKSAFDTECRRKTSELADREAVLIDLQRQTKIDADAAATARADLDRRLKLIKAATS
jgi:hypothetical protein